MNVKPDPKPQRRKRRRSRIVDPTASKRILLARPRCAACGARATNCHHVLGRPQGGDDVDVNLVPLCGSGSQGCHGALHGNPYVAEGERWDAARVTSRIGVWIARHPETVAYVLERLGDEPGRDYLRRRYGVDSA